MELWNRGERGRAVNLRKPTRRQEPARPGDVVTVEGTLDPVGTAATRRLRYAIVLTAADVARVAPLSATY